MGSSKKHKEKREKKKHKKNRSRSCERESHRRSHKSSNKDRRRSRERNVEDVLDPKASSSKVRDSDSDECIEIATSRLPEHPSIKTLLEFQEEDELDIDELLDSKLLENPEFSTTKPSRKKSRSVAIEKLLLSKVATKVEAEDDESLERFAPQQQEHHAELPFQKEQWGTEKPEVYGLPVKIKQEVVDTTNFSEESTVGDPGSAFGGQSQLSLSIENTNKLRAKLGLKPLQVTEEIPGLGGPAEQESQSNDAAKEVFVKTENISEQKEAAKLKEKLQTLKEKRKIAEKLRNVKTLGESDSEEESASAWVKKSRKQQKEKEQAEKRAKLLEEMDAEFGVGALVEEAFADKKKKYTSRDLRGLKVGHDSGAFKEGQHVILTLKDRGVLDEDGDTLQNVNIIDDERYAKNVENRKRKPTYQPYEEEYDEFGILKKKNLLSKYDEEIEGEKKKSFTLGSSHIHDREKELELIRMKLNQQKGTTLEMTNIRLASEYYTAEDMVQFKKPKKKKKKPRKGAMLKADDLLSSIAENHSTDFGSRRGFRIPGIDIEQDEEEYLYNEPAKANGEVEPKPEDVEMVDGEDNVPELINSAGGVIDEEAAEKELHSALSKARKLKQRKAISAPEKIAMEVLKSTDEGGTDVQSSKSGHIVLNSTAEFCRSLGDIPTYGMSGNRDEEADELMDFERELMEERQRQELEARNRGAWNEVNIEEEPTEIMIRENEPILEEEPDISKGVAGALKLAQKKGYLDKEAKKIASGPKASYLQAQSYTIEEKFYEDDKFGKRDRYTGPIQDFREKSSYRPDVKLEYIDDSGRLLNAKEAFRYLSHKFHGKGPGKNKVDKRMKKLDQDTKLKQMSSTDTPLNTVKLLQAKQKETQSPFIVLSGGSKALTQTMISKTKT